MKYLRKATVATVVAGPFVAIADGVTPKTALTTSSTLNGRAVTNGVGAAFTPATFTHDANGHYLVPLATTDVPTAGRFRLEFSDPTTYCPVWDDYTVLEGAVYDAIFGTVALSTYAGGAVASVTAGVTVTTNNDKTGYSLTQAFPANFSALAITSGGAVTVGTNSDKTGYSLTQTFPANFATLAITVGGDVTVGTNSDKTGYSLAQAFPTNFALLGITAAGKITEVALTDVLTTYTGNTVQTGDAYAAASSILAQATTAASNSTSILGAINRTQSGGTVVAAVSAVSVTVSGITIPVPNLGGMMATFLDSGTTDVKGRAPIASAATSGGNIALTFALPGIPTLAASDTVEIS